MRDEIDSPAEEKEFSTDAAFQTLSSMSAEDQSASIVDQFHHEYIRHFLNHEHRRLSRKQKVPDEALVARTCFAKLESCVRAFAHLNDLAREMDKERFKELFFSGSFQSCGIHKDDRNVAFYINSGRVDKGCRRLVTGSPRYKASLVALLWGFLTSFARTVGSGPGRCNVPLMVIDDFERGMLDFNFRFAQDITRIINDIFPVVGTTVFYGISRVVCPIMNIVRLIYPDDEKLLEIVFRDESLLEFLKSRVEPEPSKSGWIPQVLIEVEEASYVEEGEGRESLAAVPYDRENRRNVFMVEKLLDDEQFVTATDVYNNAGYDWDSPYRPGPAAVAHESSSCRQPALEVFAEETDDEEEEFW